MAIPIDELTCHLDNDVVCISGPCDDSLEITFRRTIRVPDNAQISELPPDMGKMSLYRVSQYTEKLPAAMAVKGGLFLPMYRMWISIVIHFASMC